MYLAATARRDRLRGSPAGTKGILCEKPLALTLGEIEQMADVCRATGTKLACGHQYRFHPVFIEAADCIRRGRLGTVTNVRGVIRGSIANNGPHLIDTLRFVLGDPLRCPGKVSMQA